MLKQDGNRCRAADGLGEAAPPDGSLLPSKRHNAGPTPERFARGSRGVAAAGAPGAARQLDSTPPPGPGPACQAMQLSQPSEWSVRNIFMNAVPADDATRHSSQPGEPRQERRAVEVSAGAAANSGEGLLTQLAAANTSVADAFCPHCGCFLADLGGPSHQAMHASACGRPKAQAAAGVERRQQLGSVGADRASPDEESWEDEEQEGNWSEQEEATQAGTATARSGGHEAGGRVQAPASGDKACGQSALAAWMEQHGLSKYTERFRLAGATLELLPCLTDQDLLQLGVAALGARKKLQLAADELREAEAAGPAGGAQPEDACWEEEEGALGLAAGGPAPAAEQQAQDAHQLEQRRAAHALAGSSGVGDWRALMAGQGAPVMSNILNYFAPVGGGSTRQPPAAANPGSIRSYLTGPDGGAVPVPAAGPGDGRGRGRGKAQQWAHKAVAAESGGGGGKRWGPRAAQVLPMRVWQLVPGTPFVVDRFCNLPAQASACRRLPSPHRHWFLTHFHADHYKGLTGKFDRGTLYCSPPTALLIQQQLRVKPGCIRTVALQSPITVEGVRVTFVEANHCPGAVMILFEPPNRRPVLHTGDCRLIPDMQQEACLAAVRGRADLILDTTYCSPEYAFPPQKEVLKFAIDAVKAEAFNPKTLFLFGSYTIGKERLFLEAARVLQRKIYVSVAKRKILDCLELPEEYRSLLTTNDQDTNLHAVPLWMVSQKHMAKLLKHYRGRFSTAVGFQPTGWTHQRDAGQTRARGRRRQKGMLITYQVPYSEHSSFSELREFVDWFKPVSIIPSVNSDGDGPKAKRLVQLLRGQG